MKRLIVIGLLLAQTASAEPVARRLYVRGGVAHIAPIESVRSVELADIDGSASLGISNGPVANSSASISSATIAALTVGFKLSQRWSIETIVGLPFEVRFTTKGALADESLAPTALGLPTGIPALGEEFGKAKAAPPTLTAVYQLRPWARVRPYVGAGVAVLFAFDEEVTNPNLLTVGKPEMSVAPAPGVVAQVGVELTVYKRIYARLDVKYIGLMLARARIEHIQIETPMLPVFESVEVGTAKMSMWVNPLIAQFGIGTDF